MQFLDQSRGQNRQARSLLRHRRPFFIHRVLYMPVDQSINARPLFFGEGPGQQDHSTKRAGLGRDRRLCFIKITPHLYGDETDQESEKDAQWR